MVGPFFYIVTKQLNYSGFLCNQVSEESAERYGKFLVDPKSHSDLFDERFRNRFIEYYRFPRGRVLFDTEKKIHIIYIDKCLYDRLAEIADLFNIKEYIVAYDEHYVCPKCRNLVGH